MNTYAILDSNNKVVNIIKELTSPIGLTSIEITNSHDYPSTGWVWVSSESNFYTEPKITTSGNSFAEGSTNTPLSMSLSRNIEQLTSSDIDIDNNLTISNFSHSGSNISLTLTKESGSDYSDGYLSFKKQISCEYNYSWDFHSIPINV